LDVSVNYEFALDSVDLTAYLRGNNLTDELAFVHTSFLKDDVPLPGRSLSLGITARF
jgi:iron complex outermembrane receptor protein